MHGVCLGCGFIVDWFAGGSVLHDWIGGLGDDFDGGGGAVFDAFAAASAFSQLHGGIFGVQIDALGAH